METQICAKRRKRHVRWDDQSGVDGAQTPVQDADDDFDGCGDEGKVVLGCEAEAGEIGRWWGGTGRRRRGSRRSDVCEETKDEADRGDAQADYGKKLEMPAI